MGWGCQPLLIIPINKHHVLKADRMQNADYDPIIKWQVFALLPGDNVTATESNVMIIIIDPTGVPCAQTQLLSKCFFSM